MAETSTAHLLKQWHTVSYHHNISYSILAVQIAKGIQIPYTEKNHKQQNNDELSNAIETDWKRW